MSPNARTIPLDVDGTTAVTVDPSKLTIELTRCELGEGRTETVWLGIEELRVLVHELRRQPGGDVFVKAIREGLGR